MKRVLLALLALCPPALAEYHPPIEYGVAATIDFVLYNTDGTLDVDEADGGAEVTIFCDGDAGTTATNDFVDEGSFYSIALTASETQCARVTLDIAATDRNVVVIPTFGNASAQVDYDGARLTEAGGTGDQLTALATQSSVDTVDANVDAILVDTGTTIPGTISTVDANVDAILVDTAEIGTAGAGLTEAGGTGDQLTALATQASVNTIDGIVDSILVDTGTTIPGTISTVDANVDAILVDTGTTLPATLGTPTDFGSGTSTLAANLQDLADNGTATFDRSTDSLQAIRDRGDAAWTTGGAGSGLTAISTGTAQSATGTTLVLASAETFADDELIGSVVHITGGSTGVGQTRCVEDNVGSTDTITVSTWTTTPTGTITYELVPSLGSTCPDDSATLATAVVDEWETQSQADPTGFHVNVLEIGGTAQTANDNGADINAILTDTGTTIPATITTAQNDLDTITGSDGVTLATTQGNYAPATVAALATVDSNVDAILVDTGTTLDGYLTDIQGATFDTATDSLEAIRNRGDAAWTTGAGGTPPQLLQNTTIATLASQTSFTLTAGSSDNDAYNGAVVVITDQSTSTQKAVGNVQDYVGSTRTVTLDADPGIFTMAVGDTVDIIASVGDAPSAASIRAEIDSNSTQLAAIVADTNELQTDITNGGRIDIILDATLADTNELQSDDVPGLIATVDANVDAILVDTGTTIPATITTVDGNVDAILVDTGTTLPASIATVDGNVDLILADTGTDGVALSAAAVDAIWNEVIETAGSTYTARCIQAISLAYAAGTWSTSGSVSTFQDPGGNSNRIVGTISASSRGSITISCP